MNGGPSPGEMLGENLEVELREVSDVVSLVKTHHPWFEERDLFYKLEDGQYSETYNSYILQYMKSMPLNKNFMEDDRLALGFLTNRELEDGYAPNEIEQLLLACDEYARAVELSSMYFLLGTLTFDEDERTIEIDDLNEFIVSTGDEGRKVNLEQFYELLSKNLEDFTHDRTELEKHLFGTRLQDTTYDIYYRINQNESDTFAHFLKKGFRVIYLPSLANVFTTLSESKFPEVQDKYLSLLKEVISHEHIHAGVIRKMSLGYMFNPHTDENPNFNPHNEIYTHFVGVLLPVLLKSGEIEELLLDCAYNYRGSEEIEGGAVELMNMYLELIKEHPEEKENIQRGLLLNAYRGEQRQALEFSGKWYYSFKYWYDLYASEHGWLSHDERLEGCTDKDYEMAR